MLIRLETNLKIHQKHHKQVELSLILLYPSRFSNLYQELGFSQKQLNLTKIHHKQTLNTWENNEGA